MKISSNKGKVSAGLLMYKVVEKELMYFLVKPGGPFYVKKDLGAWSIPKGEIEGTDDPFETAKREFYEETGMTPSEPFTYLGSIKQKSGKTVHAWAFPGDFDGNFKCTSMVELEWPRNSKKMIIFPEVEKGQFFCKEDAKKYINVMQFELIERLEKLVKI